MCSSGHTKTRMYLWCRSPTKCCFRCSPILALPKICATLQRYNIYTHMERKCGFTQLTFAALKVCKSFAKLARDDSIWKPLGHRSWENTIRSSPPSFFSSFCSVFCSVLLSLSLSLTHTPELANELLQRSHSCQGLWPTIHLSLTHTLTHTHTHTHHTTTCLHAIPTHELNEWMDGCTKPTGQKRAGKVPTWRGCVEVLPFIWSLEWTRLPRLQFPPSAGHLLTTICAK